LKRKSVVLGFLSLLIALPGTGLANVQALDDTTISNSENGIVEYVNNIESEKEIGEKIVLAETIFDNVNLVSTTPSATGGDPFGVLGGPPDPGGDPFGDNVDPTIDSIVISHTSANIGDVVIVRVKASDDQSGVWGVQGNFNTELNPGMVEDIDFVYDEIADEWVASYTIEENMMPGVWNLTVIVYDNEGNSTEETSDTQITVVNPDVDPPVLVAFEVSSNNVGVGEVIVFTASATDAKSGVYSVLGYFVSPSGVRNNVEFNQSETSNNWVGSYTIGDMDEPGNWEFVELVLEDNNGNTSVNPINETVIVDNPTVDGDAPVIESLEISTEVAEVGDEIEFQVGISDSNSGVGNATISLYNLDYWGVEFGHGPLDDDLTMYKRLELVFDEDNNIWTAKYIVKESDLKGIWNVYITAEDNAGNVEANIYGSVEFVNKAVDITPPEKPTVNGVTNLSTEITGTSEVGTIVSVSVGSEELGSVETESDGTFTLTIPTQNAGVVLSVTATDKDGIVSAVETVTVEMIAENSTSRLGHINGGESFIYTNSPGDANRISSEEFKHSVYYIKKEATYKSELYYLLSTQSSATNGTIGWMKASDISSFPHVGVDKVSKTFIVRGTGGAGFDTAWGGRKNQVYPELNLHKDEVFLVNLTEKVGNSIWYRGVLNGKQTWIHSRYVTELNAYVERTTSRLGHINGGESSIYSMPYNTEDKSSSEGYKNSVYYIKKEATYNEELYYLLSNNSSATTGTIGWMKATDISSHPHVGVDKKVKTLYVTGNGGAGFTRAWGGRKNSVYTDLRELKGEEFIVHLTERVGTATWYRGTLNGKQTWIRSNYVSELSAIYNEEPTSRLGHINGGKSSIYTSPYDQANEKSSDSYKNNVYYIKKQATFNGDLYYLLSTRPSATTGTIGWMKAADISSQVHHGLDKNKKMFYVTGNGGAGYDKAWGGRQNHVHPDLNSLKNELFIVDLTEKVGNNTWYRGVLNGKQTWIHSSFIEDVTESYSEQSTSRLAHINGGASLIYTSPFDEAASESSNNYKNKVYYIKRQATYKGQLYYLLSNQSSATNGVVGWMKSSDLSSQAHVGIDKKVQTFYVTGTGGAGFDTAWGGRKNYVYPDLKPLRNALFHVDLTEKVGNSIWHRGMLNGKQTWIHSSYVTSSE